MTIKFGPDAPPIELVEKDNPHGKGWHIIEGGDIKPNDNPNSDYNLFGCRHWLRYESETGTCNSGDWNEQGKYIPPKWKCPHNNRHHYWAGYFYELNVKTNHFYDPTKPEDYGHWVLGAN
jgi:hypothetical protein